MGKEQEHLVDPEPLTAIVSIISVLASVVSVGLVARSQMRERQNQIEDIERNSRNAIEDVRRELRNLGDSFEDYRSLISRAVGERNAELYMHKVRAGFNLILTVDEIKKYITNKKQIDRSVCHLSTKLNLVLELASNHNIRAANIFIELVDDLQQGINYVLSGNCTYESAFKKINELILRVTDHLRSHHTN